MKTKTFDCVELQDRAGKKLRDELKGMSVEEEVEYWRPLTERLRQRLRSRRQANRKA